MGKYNIPSSVDPLSALGGNALEWVKMGLGRKWKEEDALKKSIGSLEKEGRDIGVSGGTPEELKKKIAEFNRKKQVQLNLEKNLGISQQLTKTTEGVMKTVDSAYKTGNPEGKKFANKLLGDIANRYNTHFKNMGLTTKIDPTNLQNKAVRDITLEAGDREILDRYLQILRKDPNVKNLNSMKSGLNEYERVWSVDKGAKLREDVNTIEKQMHEKKMLTQRGDQAKALQQQKATQQAKKKEEKGLTPSYKLSETKAVDTAEQKILNNLENPASKGPATVFNRYSNKPYVYTWKEVEGFWGKKGKMTKVELPVIKGKQLTAKDIWFTANKNNKKFDDVLRDLGLTE